MKKFGMEQLCSSEMVTVRGGISLGVLKKLLALAAELTNFVEEYWGDFKRGFERGWELT